MDTESTSICVSFFYQTLARSTFTLGNASCHRKTLLLILVLFLLQNPLVHLILQLGYPV